MKAEKVEQGYTLYTFETGERFRIVQFNEHVFNVQMGLPHHNPNGNVYTRFYKGMNFETLEDALEHIKKTEILITKGKNYPIYH